jgi:acetyl esterase/lipase
MHRLLCLLCTLSAGFAADVPSLSPTKADVPYAGTQDFRQTLNVYAPATKPTKPAPVIFWIHGGGWQGGEKTSVQLKPKFFTDLGYVFVATNHRYVKAVPMNEIIADIAKALRWTHDHVGEFGGDAERIVIMGHSSGAQLAAYLAIDARPLKTEGLSLAMFKGCVPVDADTFDIPAVIAKATAARQAAGKPEPKYGHREIFGGKPELWADYSAVTHVAAGKGIPPFLILYDAAAALTPDQAKRLEGALTAKGIPAKAFGAQNTDHGKINADLGLDSDPSTAEVRAFLKSVLAN